MNKSNLNAIQKSSPSSPSLCSIHCDKIQIQKDEIAIKCVDAYNKLPKTGKPNNNEWTILTCIVEENLETNTLKVVSLGTGTKCIGQNSLVQDGSVLNDSHAEIICRRAFLRYLYNQIANLVNSENSIFNFHTKSKKCKLKHFVKFHMFTTQTPCGDASIFPKQTTSVLNEMNSSDNVLKRKSDNSFNDEINLTKYQKTEHTEESINDIHRTGAKCLKNNSVKDPQLSGINYHIVGAIRTKPGRGDPTLSVSCSDKIAKWIRLGIQGALLLLLIDCPIYITSIVLPRNAPFCSNAFNRALITRFNNNFLTAITPIVLQSNVDFNYKLENQTPCPSSIIWCDNKIRPLEVSVNGRKQGITRKQFNSPKAQVLICKRQLLNQFLEITQMENNQFEINLESIKTYEDLKLMATEYQKQWFICKGKVFKIWTEKNKSFQQFPIR